MFTLDTECFHTRAECGRLDTEQCGGAVWTGDFSIARFESRENILPLQVFQLFCCTHTLDRGCSDTEADAFRQGALEIQLAIARSDDGALDYILQFADITGPTISFKTANTVWREWVD